MSRLFLGLEINNSLSQFIKDICPTRKHVIPQPDLHLTLHFIGELKSKDILELETLLNEIRFKPFILKLSGVNSFDKGRLPHFLVIKAILSKELELLHKSIADCLNKLNLALEERVYKPHITISKLCEKDEELTNKFKVDHQQLSISGQMSEFALYEVDNSAKKPRYFIRKSFKADI